MKTEEQIKEQRIALIEEANDWASDYANNGPRHEDFKHCLHMAMRCHTMIQALDWILDDNNQDAL